MNESWYCAAQRSSEYRTTNIRPQLRIYPCKRVQPAVCNKECERKRRIGVVGGTFFAKFRTISSQNHVGITRIPRSGPMASYAWIFRHKVALFPCIAASHGMKILRRSQIFVHLKCSYIRPRNPICHDLLCTTTPSLIDLDLCFPASSVALLFICKPSLCLPARTATVLYPILLVHVDSSVRPLAGCVLAVVHCSRFPPLVSKLYSYCFEAVGLELRD
jgi:hypothetical protein